MRAVLGNSMTERQRREKEYYDNYAKKFALEGKKIDLSPVLGPVSGGERRPWNSYWRLYELASLAGRPGDRLLDFGSGPGENALRFASAGYDVEGFDISGENVKVARKLFALNDVKGVFEVSGAESLPYEDESFDVIAGIDILHHVDIPLALRECARVLKKGGKAFFREPVESPFLDRVRNTKAVLALAPKDASFERHITEDERKLNRLDEEEIFKVFPKHRKESFCVLSRLDKFFREGAHPRPSLLERVDHFLLKTLPGVSRFAGAAVYELEK